MKKAAVQRQSAAQPLFFVPFLSRFRRDKGGTGPGYGGTFYPISRTRPQMPIRPYTRANTIRTALTTPSIFDGLGEG